MAAVLFIPFSLALTRLLISSCRRGMGRSQANKEQDHRDDSLDTNDSDVMDGNGMDGSNVL